MMPCIVGLTGGIASGKSTVGEILKKKGYPVYNSDLRAKEIVIENQEVKQNIIAFLGHQSFNSKGEYNRNWVAKQVFNNPEKLSFLNRLIHPAVAEDFKLWLSKQNSEIVFKESALLFELNLDQQTDISLLVIADEEIRIQRAMKRDNKSKEEIQNILSRQLPDIEKEKKADILLQNNKGLTELEIKIQTTLKHIHNICYFKKNRK